MNLYKIAQLNVLLDYFGPTMQKQSVPYQIQADTPPDITVKSAFTPQIIPAVPLSECKKKQLKDGSVSYSAILGDWHHTYREERFLDHTAIKLHTANHKNGLDTCYDFSGSLSFASGLSPADLEYLYTGSAFAKALISFQGFVLHASAISLDGEAVLFSAPSGTGKSTHTSLWQQYFGPDRTTILNDDKPPVRLIDQKFYAYGAPWSGKHDISVNARFPLKAIVFLEQAPVNSIRRLSSQEAIPLLLFQILKASSGKKIDLLLQTLDMLLMQIPVYKMGCTISEEAVLMAYQKLYTGG